MQKSQDLLNRGQHKQICFNFRAFAYSVTILLAEAMVLSEVLEKLPLSGWGDRKILGQLLLVHSSNSGV